MQEGIALSVIHLVLFSYTIEQIHHQKYFANNSLQKVPEICI